VPTSAAGMAPPPHDEEPADVPDLPGKVATSPAAPTTPIADP
jgi:hypothetical protein